jgi:CPA2 family monovalent cation:H+ antiporter-2
MSYKSNFSLTTFLCTLPLICTILMSFEIQIITDLSVLLVISAVVALIFYKLKQPIVIGYLIAGIIIGPYTPPFSLVSHVEILNVFAEIGVILLLFTIGLEFPISKLRSIAELSSVFPLSKFL